MLPREQSLQAASGLSRGVVREALGALEARGVVRIRHGLGASLQPRELWDVLDADVAAALIVGRGGRALVRELAECRLVLEPSAAGLAAERATEGDLRQLAISLERLESAEGDPLIDRLVEFHTGVVASARNRAITQTLQRPIALHVRHCSRRARPTVPECRATLDALVAGDVDAARGASRAQLERAWLAAGGRRRA